MTETTFASASRPAAHHRYLPLLLFLFIGSGCAALIYEIVWFQLLQLVIGSSGNGSVQHLAGEAFKRAFGLQTLHLPFGDERFIWDWLPGEPRPTGGL